MPHVDKAVLRANYMMNLISIIDTIQKQGKFLAVAGPGILGENAIFKMPKFLGKSQMLNDYRAMNRAITNSFGFRYMDIRQHFLDTIPSWYLFGSGYLTVDGEHENEAGTNKVADIFVDTMASWLQQLKNATSAT